MNQSEIITLLDYYGHLNSPFGIPRRISVDPSEVTLDSEVVHKAIQSYQSLHMPTLERIHTRFWPRGGMPVATGTLTSATVALLETARCHTPDYAMLVEPAQGGGNWRGCHGIGNFHAAVVRFTNSPPSFLVPIMDQIWERVVASYAEIGLQFIRDDDAPNPNIEISFVRPDGGWIGLAIVGVGQGCSDQIWARFDNGYQPSNLISEWTTLMKHELGHNCGLNHSSGGVMNPFIVNGLPVTWAGDPSLPLLASRFGGQPVPRENPPTSELVLARRTGDDFEVLKVLTSEDRFKWPT